jgi:hypothetical protein
VKALLLALALAVAGPAPWPVALEPVRLDDSLLEAWPDTMPEVLNPWLWEKEGAR